MNTTNPTTKPTPTMNEKTETHEPLAAILAEMRASSLSTVRAWADRIEAAAEREYEEAKNYFAKLHDGPSMICTAKNCAVRNVGLSLAASPRKFDEAAPGNAAALRDALVEILDRTNREKARNYDAALNGGILEIHDIANTALAEFDRTPKGSSGDADRFATAEVAHG